MQPTVASQEVGGGNRVKCYKELKEESLDFVLLDFTNSMEKWEITFQNNVKRQSRVQRH